MKRSSINYLKKMCSSSLLLTMLLSLTTPAFAQTTAEGELPRQVYLPLISSNPQSAVAADEETTIPGQYVVVLSDTLVSAASVDAVATTLAATIGGEVLHTYHMALNGFAVKVPTATAADALAKLQADSQVSYVAADRILMLDPLESPAASQPIDEPAAAVTATDDAIAAAQSAASDTAQANPPWNLDRVDQRNLPLDDQYNYPNNGAGVRVYIIDTGIRITHHEFAGRASDGIDLVDGTLPASDCHGHGTHVAGTVGGRTYGVAKGVQLVAVRVLDCEGSGYYSDVIAGVDWVTNQKLANPTIPMVANMSLTGGAYTPLNRAIEKSIVAGVTYAVAAGNDGGINACQKSPASATPALTVAATMENDTRAEFSNIGNCVDLFAPGVRVLSAWATRDDAAAYLNGTSMATPHVAGTAALFLQSNPTASPTQVTDALLNKATPNVVSDPGKGSPNRLLYSQVNSTTSGSCFPEYSDLPAIIGTAGNDPALNGTNSAERICGLTGNDVLHGEGGDDFMAGNEGKDNLYGGPGNDTMGGGKDADYVEGSAGNDTINGGKDNDQVYGGEDADLVYGNEGNDMVGGGNGPDSIFGDAGNDQIYGGGANDNLWGGAGRDVFHYAPDQAHDTIIDFEWSNDRLRLYGVSILSYTQVGTTCQLNLSTSTTIQLLNVGACRKPTVIRSAATILPTLSGAYDGAAHSLAVHGRGFGAGEVVTLALNDTQLHSVQADENGAFTTAIMPVEAAPVYALTAPAYRLVDDASGVIEEQVGMMVEVNE